MSEISTPKILSPTSEKNVKLQFSTSNGISTTVGLLNSNEQSSFHQSIIMRQHVKEPFLKRLCQKLCPPENNYGSRYAPVVPPPKQIKKGRKTLVLDMDQTILRCELNTFSSARYSTTVRENNSEVRYHFAYRPGLEQFLQDMSKIYEIAVFTFQSKKFSEPLLRAVKEYVDIFLHRDHCSVIDGEMKKDLRVLRRDLNDVIMIDVSSVVQIENSEQAVLQLENTILIPKFAESPDDFQFEPLSEFLGFAKDLKDVRPIDSYLLLYTQGVRFNYINRQNQQQTFCNSLKESETHPFLKKIPERKTFIPIREQPDEIQEENEGQCKSNHMIGNIDEVPADEHSRENSKDNRIQF